MTDLNFRQNREYFIRRHWIGLRLLWAAVLAFFVVALCQEPALTEYKVLRYPKANEFIIDQDEVIQDIPPLFHIELEDDHYIVSGLAAWGLDPEWMTTLRVSGSGSPTGPTVKSMGDQLDDQMILYGDKDFMQHAGIRLTFHGGKQEGTLSCNASDPQGTLILDLDDMKRKDFDWLFYGNRCVLLVNIKKQTQAYYENGMLQTALYPVKSSKMEGTYFVENCGRADGEYIYELKQLSVVSDSEFYESNRWNPVTGWDDPKDKKIAKFTTAKFPFTLSSPAGTPFRLLTPVMSGTKAEAAEDLSALSHTPDERRLYGTLAEFGFPDFPDCEETEKGWRVTGLKRWGMSEDEMMIPSYKVNGTVCESDIPEIEKIRVWVSDGKPNIEIHMEKGSFTCRDLGYATTIDAAGKGELPVQYYFQNGYLRTYTVRLKNRYLLHYDPAFTINANTLSAGLKPSFECHSIIDRNDVDRRWDWNHGSWTGDSGPLPFDESLIPPPMDWPN